MEGKGEELWPCCGGRNGRSCTSGPGPAPAASLPGSVARVRLEKFFEWPKPTGLYTLSDSDFADLFFRIFFNRERTPNGPDCSPSLIYSARSSSHSFPP